MNMFLFWVGAGKYWAKRSKFGEYLQSCFGPGDRASCFVIGGLIRVPQTCMFKYPYMRYECSNWVEKCCMWFRGGVLRWHNYNFGNTLLWKCWSITFLFYFGLFAHCNIFFQAQREYYHYHIIVYLSKQKLSGTSAGCWKRCSKASDQIF